MITLGNGKARFSVVVPLEREGIYVRKYFYPLTNAFERFHRRYDVGRIPIALHLSKRVPTFSVYGELEKGDVIECVKQ